MNWIFNFQYYYRDKYCSQFLNIYFFYSNITIKRHLTQLNSRNLINLFCSHCLCLFGLLLKWHDVITTERLNKTCCKQLFNGELSTSTTKIKTSNTETANICIIRPFNHYLCLRLQKTQQISFPLPFFLLFLSHIDIILTLYHG